MNPPSDEAIHSQGVALERVSSVLTQQRPVEVYLFVALVACAVAIRIAFAQPPINSDDIQYFDLANATLGGWNDSAKHLSLRPTMIGLGMMTHLMFGHSIVGFYFTVILAASIGLIGISLFTATFAPGRVLAVLMFWATSLVFIDTDTRLVPDNIGIGLSLVSFTLAAWGCQTASARSSLLLLAGAGFLGWAAWASRATFAPVMLANFILVAARTRRISPVIALCVGFLVGFVVELVYCWAVVGDPLARLKTLLGYGGSVSGVESFYGYQASDMITRYPVLLGKLFPDGVIALVGIGGVVVWLGHAKHNGAKLLIAGLLALPVLFAVVSIDPILPLMREKVRYSAVFLPFLFVAAADLGYLVWAKLESAFEPSIARIGLVLTVLAIVSGLALSLWRAHPKPNSFAAGNTALPIAYERVRAHRGDRQHDVEICTDFRTHRVLRLHADKDRSWSGCDLQSPKNYRLLNWRRLNANVKQRFLHAPQTRAVARAIEESPLLLRHRYAAYLTDVFAPADNEFNRSVVTRQNFSATSLVELTTGAKSVVPPFVDENGARLSPGAFLSTGSSPPWRFEQSPFPGETILQVVFNGQADEMSQIHVYAYLWETVDKKYRRNYLGRVFVDEVRREYSLWTYLPKPAYESQKVAIRNVSDGFVFVDDLRIRTLAPSAEDNLDAEGNAW